MHFAHDEGSQCKCLKSIAQSHYAHFRLVLDDLHACKSKARENGKSTEYIRDIEEETEKMQLRLSAIDNILAQYREMKVNSFIYSKIWLTYMYIEYIEYFNMFNVMAR